MTRTATKVVLAITETLQVRSVQYLLSLTVAFTEVGSNPTWGLDASSVTVAWMEPSVGEMSAEISVRGRGEEGVACVVWEKRGRYVCTIPDSHWLDIQE